MGEVAAVEGQPGKIEAQQDEVAAVEPLSTDNVTVIDDEYGV